MLALLPMHFALLVSFFFDFLLIPANAAAASTHDADNTTSTHGHPSLLVRTSSGTVLGAFMGPHVIAWRGIPYAEAPLGPLRFEPPRAITRQRERIIDARQYGPACFQFKYALALPSETASEEQSEDCLTVNIFRRLNNAAGTAGVAPTNATSGLLPVLVWVHGGAFTEGSGWLGPQPPDLILNHPEFIVATFNYRLNIFGFPDTRAISNATANAGLRDQRLALAWLRDNVRAFGGDPERLVAVGVSAGSTSLVTSLLAFPHDPIIQGAILMSGPGSLAGSPSDSSEFRRVAANVGCSSRGTAATDATAAATNSSSDVANTNTTSTSSGSEEDLERDRRELECMKRVDARHLARGVSNTTLNAFGAPRGGYPRYDNVLVFTPQESIRRGQEGQFARVPIVIGHTEHEGDTVVPWTPQGINYTFSDYVTTTIFHCPISIEARILASHGVPTWRYLFRGIFPSFKVVPWQRAYHAKDIFLLWGVVLTGQPPRPAERAAMAYLQNAWAAFVLDPHKGLTEFGWPSYSTQGNASTLVELFPNNQVGAEYTNADAYDKVCV